MSLPCLPDLTGVVCALLLLPLALLLDHFLGEPPERLHPVCWMGRVIAGCEAWARSHVNLERPGLALAAGTVCVLCVHLLFCLPVLAGVALLARLHPLAGCVGAAVCIWLCMAPRSLAEHARAVLRPLAMGQLEKARRMLSRMVGRQTATLDEHAVARACVESVAENCTDGVTASLFWACAGFILGGMPLAAALCVQHRLANTLDAMWGKKSDRYLYFGRCAARWDDVLGFLPARLTLFFVVAASLCVPGTSAKDALTIGLRDHAAHESPNSAWSEAAFAGALHLRLGGPAVYAGRLVSHPWLGSGTKDAEPQHIARAIALMQATTCCAVLCLGLVCVLAA